jgi:hypothetical protein
MIVESADSVCIRDRLAGWAINHGFRVHSSSDTQIVIARRESRFAAAMLSTPAGGNPERRATFTLTSAGTGRTRIVLNDDVVQNPGTGFEHVIERTPQAAERDAMNRDLSSVFAQQPCRSPDPKPPAAQPSGTNRRPAQLRS